MLDGLMILKDVASAHGVDAGAVLGKSRAGSLPRARHETWSKLHSLGQSKHSIARAFGVEQRAITFGIRAHEKRLEARQ